MERLCGVCSGELVEEPISVPEGSEDDPETQLVCVVCGMEYGDGEDGD